MLAAFIGTLPYLPLSCPCYPPLHPLPGALLALSARLFPFLTCTLLHPALRLLLFIPLPRGSLWLRARASRRDRRAAQEVCLHQVVGAVPLAARWAAVRAPSGHRRPTLPAFVACLRRRAHIGAGSRCLLLPSLPLALPYMLP